MLGWWLKYPLSFLVDESLMFVVIIDLPSRHPHYRPRPRDCLHSHACMESIERHYGHPFVEHQQLI